MPKGFLKHAACGVLIVGINLLAIISHPSCSLRRHIYVRFGIDINGNHENLHNLMMKMIERDRGRTEEKLTDRREEWVAVPEQSECITH